MQVDRYLGWVRTRLHESATLLVGAVVLSFVLGFATAWGIGNSSSEPEAYTVIGKRTETVIVRRVSTLTVYETRYIVEFLLSGDVRTIEYDEENKACYVKAKLGEPLPTRATTADETQPTATEARASLRAFLDNNCR